MWHKEPLDHRTWWVYSKAQYSTPQTSHSFWKESSNIAVPNLFLAPGTGLGEDNFSMGQGGGGGRRWFWDDSSALHLLCTLFLLLLYQLHLRSSGIRSLSLGTSGLTLKSEEGQVPLVKGIIPWSKNHKKKKKNLSSWFSWYKTSKLNWNCLVSLSMVTLYITHQQQPQRQWLS